MLKINEIYAFIADNEDSEGLMAFKTSSGWIPMTGADMARVKSLYPIALKISKATGKNFKILKFSKREDITKEYKEVNNGKI